MPRQANGSYIQPGGTAAVSGQVISSTAFNALETDIGSEITNSLDRLGRGGMAANFNLNGNRAISAAPAILPNDLLTLAQATALAQSSYYALNNAALMALPAAGATIVLRASYSSIGDSPPVFYQSSGSPCTLNAGAGDGGSQIPSSDGGSWRLIFPTGGVTPKIWGAVSGGVTPSQTALQAMFDYIGSLSPSPSFSNQYAINGEGETFATQSPLTPPSYLDMSDISIIAVSGGLGWLGNGGVDRAYGTNGILTFNGNGYVTLRNVTLDANYVAAVQCMYAYGSENYKLTFDNCTWRRWASTGNGCVMHASAAANFFNCDFQQYPFGNSGGGGTWGSPSTYGGMGLAFIAAFDSTMINCNFADTKYPVFVDYNSTTLRFIGCHVYNENSGSPVTNFIGILYQGTNCTFDGTYLDVSAFKIEVSASTLNSAPNVSITNTLSLYAPAQFNLSGWIQIATTLASTPLYGIKVSNNKLSSGILSLTGTLNATTTITGISTTASLAVGMVVQGTGIPANTAIATIASGTSITLTSAATISATETLQFTVPCFQLTASGAGSYTSNGAAMPASVLSRINTLTGDADFNEVGGATVNALTNIDMLTQGYVTGNVRNVITITGTTYTLKEGDTGNTLVFNNALGCTVTCPSSMLVTLNVRLYHSNHLGSLVVASGGFLNALGAPGTQVLKFGALYILECPFPSATAPQYTVAGSGM